MFATVIRNRFNKNLIYYEGNSFESITMPHIPGDELRVYVGTYHGVVGSPNRQVVLANEHPYPGSNAETFDLVFVGPREQAIEIFEAHVGMLP